MVGVSQVIQTLGAIVIFSLILLTANRVILTNTAHEVETEAVGTAITLAQDIINEAQTKAFDANTADGSIPVILPEGFSSCGPAGSAPRSQFNDFDDYDGYHETVDMDDSLTGEYLFKVEVAVSYVSPTDFKMSSGSKGVNANERTMYKKMVVTVTGDYLNDEIKLSYLRRYYKADN